MKVPFLLAGKDVRMLVRTWPLMLLLALYPIVMALILAGVLFQQGPPRIAFVNEDKTGDVVQIGEDEFAVSSYVERAERNGVEVEEMTRDEAERALDEGQVAGVLVIPGGTVAKLNTQLSGADLDFLIGDNPLGTVVAQRMRGVVYNINLDISEALIEANRDYLDKLVTGGEVVVEGEDFDLYGLGPIEDDLREAREELDDADADEDLIERLDRAIEFADDAGAAIGLADNALEATAAPIRLDVERTPGKSPLVTAQAIAFGLAALIAFACVVLIAASLAAERDEAVLGRLLHGLASAWQVVAGKLLIGIALSLLLSLSAIVLLVVVEPSAWTRIPLLLLCAAVVGLACSAIGALIAVLVRDARTATLVGILLILPLAPLALVGGDGPLSWLENALPMGPGRDLFNAVLFDQSPWDTVRARIPQLLLIAAVPAAIASRLLRRLA